MAIAQFRTDMGWFVGTQAGNSLSDGSTSGSALGPNRRFIVRGPDTYINGSKILATNVSA